MTIECQYLTLTVKMSLRGILSALCGTHLHCVPAPGFVCPMWLAGIGAPLITAFDRPAKIDTKLIPSFPPGSLKELDMCQLANYNSAHGE